MSTVEITSKIEALKDLESLIEEAKAEAEALRDEIKTEMLNRNTEELEAGQYIVRWTSVLSQRFDTTSFKKVMPEVYKAYTKQVSSKRFSIKPMSPEEAILQMNLLDHQFYMFLNADTGIINVVYGRKDSGYGLIIPDYDD